MKGNEGMIASHKDMKRHVLALLDTLPDESWAEVAAFIDFQHYKLGRKRDEASPYRPIPLAGVWQGIRIDDDVIADVRDEMWARFRVPDE
jgi:hypothetical protein